MDSMPMDEEGGDFSATLTARLSKLSPDEMSTLDAAITPEVGDILKKVLPELTDVIDAVMQATEGEGDVMEGVDNEAMEEPAGGTAPRGMGALS